MIVLNDLCIYFQHIVELHVHRVPHWHRAHNVLNVPSHV